MVMFSIKVVLPGRLLCLKLVAKIEKCLLGRNFKDGGRKKKWVEGRKRWWKEEKVGGRKKKIGAKKNYRVS